MVYDAGEEAASASVAACARRPRSIARATSAGRLSGGSMLGLLLPATVRIRRRRSRQTVEVDSVAELHLDHAGTPDGVLSDAVSAPSVPRSSSMANELVEAAEQAARKTRLE